MSTKSKWFNIKILAFCLKSEIRVPLNKRGEIVEIFQRYWVICVLKSFVNQVVPS